MGTLTTNYSFQKPTVGADPDTWGDDFGGGDDPLVDASPGLNGNWEKLDQLLNQLQTQVDNQQIKVGDIYISSDASDPATKLGYGTWAAYGEGRTIIGVGTSDTSVGRTWANGETDGLEEHTLVEDEIPSHLHDDGTLVANNSNVIATFTGRKRTGGNAFFGAGTNTTVGTLSSSSSRVEDGSGTGSVDQVVISVPNSHTISGDTGSTGGGNAHNNLPPVIATYVWVRTA